MTASVVHIVDDDEPTRDSLQFLLAASGFAARAHASATDFLRGVPHRDAGCLVTDVRMPDMSGIELLTAVRARQPDLPVVVVTGHGDISLAVEAMKLGAVDFLEKPYSDEAMIAAVEAAIARRSDDARTSAEASETDARIASLSPRERQVLEGVVAGKANKVIAYDLDISPRTVEVYRANLMTKMQATSLSHLVRLALMAGVGIEPDRA
ncbi:MAG: response regulator [Chitinophagaceae bacterium]|nr:response regulator [Bauldia sp.]MCW5929962.1 response regulator [Chitinophagaceae bacterium]